jgi:hypothetical protein
MDISGKAAIVTGAASGIALGVATVLAEAGANVDGQTVNLAEQQSAELWPLLWPLEATLDALCTLGAQAIRGVKRLLFASFSHFSGKLKNPGIDLQNRCSTTDLIWGHIVTCWRGSAQESFAISDAPPKSRVSSKRSRFYPTF